MSGLTIDWLPAVGAGVAAFMLGGLWYGPLFGRTWSAAHGLPEDYRIPPSVYAVGVASYVLMALAFSALSSLIGIATVTGGVWLALGIWFGFVLLTGLNSSLFASRPRSITAIDSSYHLASLVVIGIIVGATAGPTA